MPTNRQHLKVMSNSELIARLNVELAELQASRDTAEQRVSDLEDEIEGMDEEIEEIRDEIAELSSKPVVD